MTTAPSAGENPSPLPRPGFMTKEISGPTGIPENTLRRAIKAGKIPAHRVGGTYLVPVDVVKRLFPEVNF